MLLLGLCVVVSKTGGLKVAWKALFEIENFVCVCLCGVGVNEKDLGGNLQEAILGAHNGKYEETDPLSYKFQARVNKNFFFNIS
jgi:hypothetical protein